MIVLNVTYKCKPGLRDEFLEMIFTEGIDRACRAEDGNIRYDYYTPVEGGDELFLLEKWRDADALAKHAGQPNACYDAHACAQNAVVPWAQGKPPRCVQQHHGYGNE